MINSESENKQQELDTTQYTAEVIDHYEQVFGLDFVSPGGIEAARSMIAFLGLSSGAYVLDVGCGLGGAAFLMAREFNLRVHGIDLSRNMLAEATRRLNTYGLDEQICLVHGNCLELQETAVYDAIYSRDVFLHIDDKPRLFKVLHRALKPGGKLLFTDYCCGPQPWQKAFADYVAQRGYQLSTLGQYEALLSAAGFGGVVVQDTTDQFQRILITEIQAITALAIPEQEKQALLASWEGKLARSADGDHRWGLVTAVKNA